MVRFQFYPIIKINIKKFVIIIIITSVKTDVYIHLLNMHDIILIVDDIVMLLS